MLLLSTSAAIGWSEDTGQASMISKDYSVMITHTIMTHGRMDSLNLSKAGSTYFTYMLCAP